jgi:glutaredoxin 3
MQLAFRSRSAVPRAVPCTRISHSRIVAVKAEPTFPGEKLINRISVGVTNSFLNDGKIMLAKAQAGDYDEVAMKAKLEAYIKEDAVVVFSWTTCPFCVKAKALLTETGAKFTAIELDKMPEGKALRVELAKLTNRTSMPNVFVTGTSYGGCNDGPGVMTLQKEGKLIPLLQGAGAL